MDSVRVKNALPSLLTFAVLALCCIVGFAVRMFSIVRYESIIHEFDPWFNYRATHYMVENGFYKFLNWFDDRAWYPLGRIVGGTIYPGLMVTSGLLHYILHAIHLPVYIRDLCVFLAPLFSGLTAISTYLLTKEVSSAGAGLFAAGLVAIVPGYCSRSVAGSYDNEGIAIFALQFTYFLWIRAVRTGSVYWSVLSALSYFYMVSAWGGYVFIINLIPLHILLLIITGRFTNRAYIAYSTFYVLGSILSMQIPFVGFQPVTTSEHMGAFGVFGLCQIVAFSQWMQSKMSQEKYNVIFRSVLLLIGITGGLFLLIATFLQKIAPWTGRFYSLLDPSYAKNHIPIISSVSEHQPTAWSSYYYDLQFLTFLFPVGLYYIFKKLSDLNIFIILYAVTSIYFCGVMVRLMLVLAPISCILGGIALHGLVTGYMRNIEDSSTEPQAQTKSKREKNAENNYPYKSEIAHAFIGMIAVFLATFVFHSVWVTSESYSSPSIVLAGRGGGPGQRVIFDDFREAYYWLRQNTDENAKIMSWWDYGYQTAAMANRTVIVDNNTWNNTHISRVGQAMAMSEDKSYEIMRELDVDYVLIIFGGYIGFSSDDINKFLWMVRIGGSTPEGASIKERDYLTDVGDYRIDSKVSETMKNSVMYKLCYYRFGQVLTEHGQPGGFDRVRRQVIGYKDFELEHLEEAYTTEHWLVRIYKVKKPNNRGV
uniref:Dolichyl-diphosphooligosaccharide--protein glycotransferase n=1 Tax=Panagrolaimus sp. JU765 TaxID=591449 RepID=A0AC34QP97_9BILA